MTNQSKIISKISETFAVNGIYGQRLLHTVNKDDVLAYIPKLLEKKPKPFVKWVGGKRQLLKQLRELNLYPPEDFDPINSNYF